MSYYVIVEMETEIPCSINDSNRGIERFDVYLDERSAIEALPIVIELERGKGLSFKIQPISIDWEK